MLVIIWSICAWLYMGMGSCGGAAAYIFWAGRFGAGPPCTCGGIVGYTNGVLKKFGCTFCELVKLACVVFWFWCSWVFDIVGDTDLDEERNGVERSAESSVSGV